MFCMNTELNKRVATGLFARFTASDLAGVLDTMTEDATWLIPGKPGSSPAVGLYDKRRIGRLFQAMLDRLNSGLTMTVSSAIAEGDKVALEVRSHGELTNRNVYRQEYHFLMEFRDGKICAVREYLDTQHAHAVWFQSPP
jgi:ketosteroid isomerase-like protein